ncbi:hypothetical protein V3C99_014253 [Haemonchus contortus]
MHLQIISVVFCIVLSVQGYNRDDNCQRNVPRNVQNTLLEVIKKKCSGTQGNISYDCELGVRAFEGKSANNKRSAVSAYDFTYFGGKSNFDFDWNSTLTKAIENADTVTSPTAQPVTIMCAFSTITIGCHIDLNTAKETGTHELDLRCNYKMLS